MIDLFYPPQITPGEPSRVHICSDQQERFHDIGRKRKYTTEQWIEHERTRKRELERRRRIAKSEKLKGSCK